MVKSSGARPTLVQFLTVGFFLLAFLRAMEPGVAAAPARSLPPDYQEPEIRSSFTGLEIDPETLSRKPLALVVDNHPAARPQSGLPSADLILEVPVEGGITRLLTVYWSQYPDLVGPVRSARHYYLDLALSLESIIVHIGGSPQAYALLNSSPRPHFNAMFLSDGFTWVTFRRQPHSLYAQPQRLSQLALARGWTGPWDRDMGWSFMAPRELPPGPLAHRIEVALARTGSERMAFNYDVSQGVYRKEIGGTLQVDHETGAPLQFSNLILLRVPMHVIPGDREGRMDINLSGAGQAELFIRGRRLLGQWEGDGGFPRITGPQGESLELSPGVTWMVLLPPGSEVAVP